MKNFFKILLAMFALVAQQAAFSQTPTPTPAPLQIDKLIYEQSSGFFSIKADVKMQTLGNGFQLYESSRSRFLFHPVAHALVTGTDLATFNPDLKIGEVKDKAWTASHSSPAAGACAEKSYTQLEATQSPEEKNYTIKINGKDTAIAGVEVNIKSTWKACQYSGYSIRSAVFLPSLGILYASKASQHLDGGQRLGGGSATLLEVVTKP